MALKLLEMAQQRWPRLNASELLPLVRAAVPFRDESELRGTTSYLNSNRGGRLIIRSTTFDNASSDDGFTG